MVFNSKNLQLLTVFSTDPNVGENTEIKQSFPSNPKLPIKDFAFSHKILKLSFFNFKNNQFRDCFVVVGSDRWIRLYQISQVEKLILSSYDQ